MTISTWHSVAEESKKQSHPYQVFMYVPYENNVMNWDQFMYIAKQFH
jgi:hypothetical protein